MEALRKEGEGVKGQGGVEEARMVDRWVTDVASRWEDLNAAVEEREVRTKRLTFCILACTQAHLPLL